MLVASLGPPRPAAMDPRIQLKDRLARHVVQLRQEGDSGDSVRTSGVVAERSSSVGFAAGENGCPPYVAGHQKHFLVQTALLADQAD